MLNNLAWAYAETGDFASAVPLARRAWSLDRDNPATADTLGWLLFKAAAAPRARAAGAGRARRAERRGDQRSAWSRRGGASARPSAAPAGPD